jgi:ComF family protein
MRVQALTSYRGLSKRLVWRLKFRNARSVGNEIGRLLAPLATEIGRDTVVVHIPTATSRVRRRGYDQAALIAKGLAKHSGLRYRPLLYRLGQHKQVGANSTRRKVQMKQAFRVHRPHLVSGSNIIIVDDVVTTGATLEAATRVLKSAGAKRIEAIVFARA